MTMLLVGSVLVQTAVIKHSGAKSLYSLSEALKTQLLPIHVCPRVQYLPSSDVVVVMADGQITHMGHYEQLTAQG
jgi:ABC-type protease/lipase transport system fused ATPase/permease subunit